jgi:hypothetical protein
VNLSTPGGAEQILHALDSMVYQYLNIHLVPFGSITYHPNVENSIRKMEPRLKSETALSALFMKMAGDLIAEWSLDRRRAAPNLPESKPLPTGFEEKAGAPVHLCLHDEALCQGTKLHIQTQDLGDEKARIATLVFRDGEVLFSRVSGYRELLEQEHARQAVEERVKTQHRRMIADVNLYLDSNLRKSVRVRIHLPVEYKQDDKYFQSVLASISENGAFIISLTPPPEGAEIAMRFLLPEGNQQVVVIGKVLYTNNLNWARNIIVYPSSPDKKIVAMPGIGVRFDRLSHADQIAIRNFLQKEQ